MSTTWNRGRWRGDSNPGKPFPSRSSARNPRSNRYSTRSRPRRAPTFTSRPARFRTRSSTRSPKTPTKTAGRSSCSRSPTATRPGRQMSVSIGRKLQAFRDLLFPKFRFEVVPVALTVEQVQELGLPSTPLKETEKRASRWREAFGVEQTEIDALATLRPNVLRGIIEAAFQPYYDDTLEDRVDEARTDWTTRAQAAIDEQVDPEVLAALRAEATERLSELESVIADLNERFQLAGDRFDLPVIEVPQPEIDMDASRLALIGLNDSW